MPLINCDVKSLEVFVAADLSNDGILKQELLERLDLHSLNQARFGLPDRVTAKRFIFKLKSGRAGRNASNEVGEFRGSPERIILSQAKKFTFKLDFLNKIWYTVRIHINRRCYAV